MVTDIDGDLVAIKTSKGTTDQLKAVVKTSGMNFTGTIQEIDFSTAQPVAGANPFIGTDLSVTVVKQGPKGDGRVNIGYIDASSTNGNLMGDGTGIALGNVKVGGDIGQIDVGLSSPTLQLKSLTAQSIGAWGGGNQGANGSNTDQLLGKIGTIKIAGAVNGSTLQFDGTVTNLDIAGSLLDSNITSTGDLLKMRIGAGVQGSNISGNAIGTALITGALHGNISAVKDLKALTVTGDLIYGRIGAANFGTIKIGGSMYGLDGVPESGSVVTGGNIKSITVGRDLRGGSAPGSGRISATGNIDAVKIGGSIVGPESVPMSFPVGYNPSQASAIVAGGNIKSVTVVGSLLGPTVPTVQGTIFYVPIVCSCISASGDIDKITIGGSIRGASGGGVSFCTRIAATHLGTVAIAGDVTGVLNVNLPEIFATGTPEKIAIAKLTIGGSLRLATVIAGSTDTAPGTPKNADGRIGTVTIRGNLDRATVAAYDVAAGVTDNVNITSSIASLIVGGQITGNSVVRAEHIVSARLGGVLLKLKAGDRNDTSPIVFAPGMGSIAEYM